MQTTTYELAHGQLIYKDICAPMTQQFCGVMKDTIIPLSPDIGAGYFRYLSPCPNTELYISDVTFYKSTVLSERAYRESFSISFCFSAALEWSRPGQTRHASLKKGECCIYENGLFDMENYYEQGQRYIGIGLNLHPSRFRAVTDCLQEKKAVISLKESLSPLPKYKITKSTETVLQQILQCSYTGHLKSLYLEGKILELASAFANEIVLEKDLAKVQKEGMAADRGVLNRIRALIDENYAEPFTIPELAKMCYMSESCLREMFRQQYGITIYQYVLERRMETARELLANQNYQVKDAASCVGYSNISHFSENFRKKYGCTPSAYKKLCFSGVLGC